MITYFRTNQKFTFEDLQKHVTKTIHQLPETISSFGTPNIIFRYEWLIDDINLLSWLHNQTEEPIKVYFSDRDNEREIAGLSKAYNVCGNDLSDVPSIFDELNDVLTEENPYLKFYGGFSFSQDISDEWQEFGNYNFIIPQFEIVKTDSECIFAFNISIKDIKDQTVQEIAENFQSINFDLETEYRRVPELLSREDHPNQEQWKEIFKQVISNLGNSEIQKTVLARKSKFDFDMDLRASALINFLKTISPDCYQYCFQLKKDLAFIGASPERLYKRYGRWLRTEALAGTKPRGSSESEDIKNQNDLLNSSKDSLEHSIVVNSINGILESLCEQFEHDENFSVLKLKGWHHLITRFEGTLNEKVEDSDILSKLHPTPAVAGWPTDKSIELIKELEPFNRGWYAAPFGYVGHDEAEFIVAIRSGLITDSTLSIYAGAGIVKESEVNDEWKEIENKISSFIKVFDNETTICT